MWTARWARLTKGDDKFCPCPPHPWRSFVLSDGPHTWEDRRAADEAWGKLPPEPYNLQEENRQIDASLAKYCEGRQRWIDTTGRQLPSKEELVKLAWKRAREHVDQESRASL